MDIKNGIPLRFQPSLYNKVFRLVLLGRDTIFSAGVLSQMIITKENDRTCKFQYCWGMDWKVQVKEEKV